MYRSVSSSCARTLETSGAHRVVSPFLHLLKGHFSPQISQRRVIALLRTQSELDQGIDVVIFMNGLDDLGSDEIVVVDAAGCRVWRVIKLAGVLYDTISTTSQVARKSG